MASPLEKMARIWHIVYMRKIIFGLVTVVVVVLGVLWLGLFPVARIEGRFVWYRDLAVSESASQHFQEKAKQKDPAFGGLEGDQATRRKAYLEELIINEVVKIELARLNKDSFQSEVDGNISRAKEGKDMARLAEATSELYGMSFPRFEDLVLEPQAREIVLRSHIESDGKVYADWLSERVKNTSVTVYFLPYVWRDGALVNK